MKIIVCIKQAPEAEAKITVENGRVSWGSAPLVISPFDEYAVEAALLQKDLLGAEVTVLCLGDESSRPALKHALAMGADQAALIADPFLTDLDTQGAARILAAAIAKLGGADLVLFGRQSADTASGVTGAQVARLLSLPFIGLVASIRVEKGSLTVERVTDEGRQSVRVALPAALGIMQSIGEPRYPSFLGIRKANKAEIPTLSLADLELEVPQTLLRRVELSAPPARAAGCEFISGETPQAIAESLVEKILAEKVL